MSNITAKIQVPLDISIKRRAEKVATESGFSSLQEVIRVFLSNFAKGDVKVTFSYDDYEVLTPAQDRKLYEKVQKALKEEMYELKPGESIFDSIKNTKDV